MRAGACLLDVWSHVDPRFGGVGPAAAALADAVCASSGWPGQQVAVCRPDETDLSDGIRATVQRVNLSKPRGFADAWVMDALRPFVAASKVCHVHGIWLPHSLAARSLAQRFGKPVISSVHGMLERWELRNKKTKKDIYAALFERPSLRTSSCLRALSQEEALDYRRFGLQNPIAVVPNGITPLKRNDPSALLSVLPTLRDKQIVLFLGRIHHKKGILNLLESWRQVVRNVPEAHLLVAGPEYEDTGARAREIVRSDRIEDSVTFCGVLRGQQKLAAFSAARCFCLPSYSEGMSVAVLEALSIGLPVVITRACNVEGIIEGKAGYVSTNDPVALAESLVKCLSLDEQGWREMSAAAQVLARTRFDWSIIGAAMHQVYSWLLGGPRPSCVID